MVGVIEDVAEVARWAKGIEGVHECIAGRFRRPEPRRRALDYLRGLLSPVERKNGWQLAEQAGDATPYGVQHLLSTYVWDADLVRDDLRDYVVEHLGDVHGVLVVDETGFLKKGNKSVGVQRQYSGTAGRIENCQIGVFLTYASAQGRTLLDRELYLPRVWADDLERRREAGVPEQVAFRTKPQLARRMLERALESGVPFGWVTGDEVYGNDRNLRLWLERRDVPHVLAVRSNEKLWAETDRGWRPVRADRLAPGVEEPGWVRRSAGDGAKGPRVYDWAWVEIRPLKEPGKGYWLLVRRSIAKPGELAYYVCFGPESTTLEELVRVAGTRWTIEECFKNALRRPRERWVWTSMKSGGPAVALPADMETSTWTNGCGGPGGVPAHHPGDAGPRLPGGGPAPGVGTRRSGRKGGCPSLDEKLIPRLIPLTVPEVRRLLYRLIWRHQPTDESVLRWSRWRRRHQATARRCQPVHPAFGGRRAYRRRLKLLTTFLQL